MARENLTEGYSTECSSNGLVIEKEDVGKIQFNSWNYGINPSSIRVGESVLLSHGFVEVEESSLKDHPARVTLYNMKIDQSYDLSQELEMRGAKLVDYFEDTNILSFDVPHFSRYDLSGIMDSDDSSEEEINDFDSPLSGKSFPKSSIIGIPDGMDDTESADSDEFDIPSPTDGDIFDSDDEFPPTNSVMSQTFTETESEESEESEGSEGSEYDDLDFQQPVGFFMVPNYGDPMGSMTPIAPNVDLDTARDDMDDDGYMDEYSDESGSSDSESDGDIKDSSFQMVNPDIDVGKAQVMKNVFFPFPHQTGGTTPKSESPTSTPLRLSNVDDFPMIEGKSKNSPELSPSNNFRSIPNTPIQKIQSVTPIFHTPSSNTLFPEEIPFPPKKKFQSNDSFGSEFSKLSQFNEIEQKPFVEYDSTQSSKKIPLKESITFPFIQKENNILPGNDYALTMGRSFGVGWGPGGLISFQSCSSNILGKVTIDNVMKYSIGISSEKNAISQYDSLLNVHLSNNHFDKNFQYLPHSENSYHDKQDKTEITNSAKNTVKNLIDVSEKRLEHLKNINSNRKQETNESKKLLDLSSHSLQVWKLIDALWGENYNDDNIIHFENSYHDFDIKPALLSCRRSLSSWGQNALKESVDTYQNELDESLPSNYLAESLINLLSGRQLRKSVDLCLEKKEYRLATIVSQVCNKQMRDQMNLQTNEWSNLFDNTIEPSLSRLYKLLGGRISECFNRTNHKDWLRCFFLFFWYGETSNSDPYITNALESFSSSNLFSDYEPFYKKNAPVYDILFQLIEYFCNGEHDIWNLVEPLSYNSYSMEYSTGWFVFIILSSLLQQTYHTRNTLPPSEQFIHKKKLYQLTIGFASQLEMAGMVHWSVYVLSHIPDDDLRLKAIQRILDRNALLLDNNEFSNLNCIDKNGNSISLEDFLKKRIFISSESIYAAKACAAAYKGEHVKQLELLLEAKMKDEAHSLFVEKIAPQSVLQFHPKSKCFLKSQYENLPILLRSLVRIMDGGEGAYRIYYDYFAAMLQKEYSEYFESQPDDLTKLIDLVRSRLSELLKYSDTNRLQLERICLSNIPSQVAEQNLGAGSIDNNMAHLALGSHHQPMPTGQQFAFFDNITNSQLYAA